MADARWIVLGAGAVGGSIGALLHRAGERVVLVARGAHLEAIRREGLTLRTPSHRWTQQIEAVDHPRAIAFSFDDVVLLCTKSQDSIAALDELSTCAPRSTPIVCLQNGVDNERAAAERFDRVHGAVVWMPASHLAPGSVAVYAEPIFGGFDVGLVPRGHDDIDEALVRALGLAGCDARVEDDVMRLKWGKLLTNLGNAVQALAGARTRRGPLLDALEAEAVACLRAAGIAFATSDEILRRYAAIPNLAIDGARRGGGSTWQSLARGTGSIETDHLNGEIVRLGARVGVPTPKNAALVRIAARAAAERWPPGKLAPDELDALISVVGSPR